ncbi:MAG TPA: hypothetical protein VMT52_19150, partial [Planctomycetota bacterium]|nr:hypothetical protein [Planctomycetota bacterium]
MNRPADSKRLTLPAAFASAFFFALVLAAVLTRSPLAERAAARRESGSCAPASTGRTSAAERAPAASTIETPAGRYRPGDLLRYRFESRSSASADFSTVTGASSAAVQAVPIASTLRGTITVKVYDAADDGWVLGFELSGLHASVAAGTASAPEAAGRLAGLMTTEVLASCERSGRLQGLRFSPGTTPEAKDLLRALIARMQVVLPDDASQKEWEVVEDDPTGRSIVHYTRLEDAEGV